MRFLAAPLLATGSLPAQARRLRLAIVGGGRIGERHREAAELSGRFRVVAATPSSDPVRAAACGARWELDPQRVYADHRAMLAGEAARADGAEVVCIATPNHCHHPIACSVLDAGLDVVCEKPMTLTADEAADLQARVAARGVVFAVAHPYLEYPMVHEARHLVRSGAIGTVTQVHAEFLLDTFARLAPTGQRHLEWRTDPARAGAGAVADIGTHAHQLVQFVSGLHVTHVGAHLAVCGGAKPVEDTAFVLLRCNGDVPGVLLVSQAATGVNQGLRLRVVGTEGAVEWCHATAHTLTLRSSSRPAMTYERIRGRGLGPDAERLMLMQPGIDQGVLEGWVNFFAQVAVACAARRDELTVPDGLLHYAGVGDGAEGVRFMHGVLASAAAGGSWVAC